MRLISLNLDEQSWKIYKQLPRGQRGKTIRKLIKNIDPKDPENFPQPQASGSSESSKNASAALDSTSTPEASLSGMARTVKHGRKSLKTEPNINMTKLWTKASKKRKQTQ